MLVFLDFDGVLRRLSAPEGQFERPCLEAFENAIRALADVEIVVSSAWRTGTPLEKIRSFFSPDVAARIVGATPSLAAVTEHGRHKEILEYLRNEGRDGVAWVAVEDDPSHFPPGCPNVILIDADRGFDLEAGQRLGGGKRPFLSEPM